MWFKLFIISIVMMNMVKTDDNTTEHGDDDLEDDGQYLVVTLRDLLYHYTSDLYDFIKTHYGENNYDPIEDVNVNETDTEDQTTVPIELENKYSSFEECRSWWNSTRYFQMSYVLSNWA